MLKTIQKGMELGASMTLDILSFGFTAVEGESMTRRTLRHHHEERLREQSHKNIEEVFADFKKRIENLDRD